MNTWYRIGSAHSDVSALALGMCSGSGITPIPTDDLMAPHQSKEDCS